LRKNLQKWVQTWNPTELRGNQQAVTVFPEPSCIVKKALKDLTTSINMSKRILHHDDEELVKTYILALHKYEPTLNADIVGAYLIRDLNCYTDNAKEIERLINILNSGSYFRGGQKSDLKYHYKCWEKECQNEN